ncbi:hypothetical protein B566_EDAN011944 [Ephemera danica]|nr:hypothetical protein B566_EDAN011944 [Ephemera danica]
MLRNVCFIAVILGSFSVTTAQDVDQVQQSLDTLIKQLASQNSSEHGTVYLAPTFSVDLVSLLRWVTDLQSQQITTPQPQRTRHLTSSALELINLGGKDYFVSINQVGTWFDALNFCDAFGMTLLNIDTTAEDTLITDHLKHIGMSESSFWTSGNKISRSTFSWANGAPLVITRWGQGQPKYPTTHHCLSINKGLWYDNDCNHNDIKFKFICES